MKKFGRQFCPVYGIAYSNSSNFHIDGCICLRYKAAPEARLGQHVVDFFKSGSYNQCRPTGTSLEPSVLDSCL